MEGTRPILVEIQALVVPSGLGTPRRAVVGWDPNRLAMLLAVIDARCGVSFAQHDVYLNVAGGLQNHRAGRRSRRRRGSRLVDIQCCRSPQERVYFGEVSLSGAVRAGRPYDQRAQGSAEARLARAALPARRRPKATARPDMRLLPVAQLDELVAWFASPQELTAKKPATILPQSRLHHCANRPIRASSPGIVIVCAARRRSLAPCPSPGSMSF